MFVIQYVQVFRKSRVIMRRETRTTRMVATDGHRHIGSELHAALPLSLKFEIFEIFEII